MLATSATLAPRRGKQYFHSRETILARLDSLTMPEPNSGCWLWLGVNRSYGYGGISLQSRYYLAHRLMYEFLVGPIPAGLTLDHKCRNRRCVNPAHLEPVTQTENVLRGLLARLGNACTRGHQLTGDNRRWEPRKDRYRLRCRICYLRTKRESSRRVRSRKRAALLGALP